MNNRHLFTPKGAVLPWVGAVIMVILIGATLYVKKSGMLSPGELSSLQTKHESLGGYVSHADFESECGHCHAPLHCITDDRCQECHQTVAQQRVDGSGLHARLPGTERCQTCHVEHKGREASITVLAYANVDHDQLSDFSLANHSLDYQEQPMDCESCHLQNTYASDSLDCINCHSQEDHDFMAGHIEFYGTTCVPCHDGNGRMVNFVHADVYPLDGQHASTDCVDCHANQVFETAARDCIECHQDPVVHKGEFGQDCSRCHTAQAWSPAYLIRHNFILSHGSDQQHECEVCHLENYTDQTCYNCHDHVPADMHRVHISEGVTDFQDCAQCHPTGEAGEAARFQQGGAILGVESPGNAKGRIELPGAKNDVEYQNQPGGQPVSTPGVKDQKEVPSMPANGKK
jgi:hypothetical protein